MIIPQWFLRCWLLVATCAFAQSGDKLQDVLNQMDEAAAKFHTTQANFTWI